MSLFLICRKAALPRFNEAVGVFTVSLHRDPFSKHKSIEGVGCLVDGEVPSSCFTEDEAISRSVPSGVSRH